MQYDKQVWDVLFFQTEILGKTTVRTTRSKSHIYLVIDNQ